MSFRVTSNESAGPLGLSGKGIGLRVVHRTGWMLGWRVDGEELERFLFRVADVVPRPGRNGNRIALLKGLPPTVEEGFALAIDRVEDLVDLVDLLTDFFAGRQRHDHQL